MKKIISAVVAMIIVLGCVTVAFAYNPDDFENEYGGKDVTDNVFVCVDAPVYMLDNCKLIVNGKEINDYNDYIKIYYDGSHQVQAQIPFVAVVKTLGAKVFWLGDNNALILYRGILFYLNIEKHLLLTSHPAGLVLGNVFDPLWLSGGVYVSEYTPLKKELIINSEYCFQYFSAICKIDREDRIIDLETATIAINTID